MSPAWPRASRLAVVAALVVIVAGRLYGQPLALAGIHGYQHAIAPLVVRAGVACRFTPSCSRYAERVIARDGLVKGGWEAARRIVRCGPWTPQGTIDQP